jgi:actin-like ATPase involved in cell morphogenesis
MAYSLGIDIGTTYTAAAVNRAGRPEILSLGTDRPTIPTVVLLRADGTVLVGEAAERRALTEPTRVAREFKRRMGDPTPFIVGGTPYGIEALTAHVMRWVLALATEREGVTPDRLQLTHPAAWGTYKLDLLGQAARMADSPPFDFLSEPQAAALRYAQEGRTVAGDVVAVYDFGGGTLDVALVQCHATDRFELIGRPEGMERLGGIDFDQAVFAHVNEAVDGMLTEIDVNDPQARAALARLRTDCRLAKEALSSDTDAVIPVILPNLQTEIRLTRTEFESMIRPRISETIETLARTVRSAGLEMPEISAVLLVGGTSRIPLIREMVHAETGLSVNLDSHPKSTISLGAALYAAQTPDQKAEKVAGPPVEAAGEDTADPEELNTPPPPPASPDPAPSGRRVPGWMLGALGVVAVAVIVAILFLRPGEDAPSAAGTSLPPDSTTATTSEPSEVTTTTLPPDTVSTTSDTTVLETTTTAQQATTPGYMRVTDATGTLSVEVPEAWNETDGEGLFLFETPSPHISASADLLGYVETWTTPGITIAVVDTAYADDTWLLNEAVSIAFGYSDACLDGGAENYNSDGLAGDAWIWLDCDGTGNALITVAASSGGDYLYLVVAQTFSDQGVEALEQALATLEFTADTFR